MINLLYVLILFSIEKLFSNVAFEIKTIKTRLYAFINSKKTLLSL